MSEHLADCEYAATLRRIAKTVGLREGFSFEAVEMRVASYRAAMNRAMLEIGIPDDTYPAPVSNAYYILRDALNPRPTSIGAKLRGE